MIRLQSWGANLEDACAKLCVDDSEREGEDDENEGRHEPEPGLDKLHRTQLCKRLPQKEKKINKKKALLGR